MFFDFSTVSPLDRYHLMIQSIIPRPIAWALTKNENKSLNLAPFSYFNAIHSNPPLVMMSIGYKQDKTKKDTRANIERHKKFVINIPSTEHAELVTSTSLSLDAGESEVDLNNLETINDWPNFELPRIKGIKIAIACRLDRVIEVGRNNQGLIFGEIEHLFVDDAICEVGDRIKIDAAAMAPLGRLGGNDYAIFGDVKTVPRPEYKPT